MVGKVRAEREEIAGRTGAGRWLILSGWREAAGGLAWSQSFLLILILV